MSGGVFWILWCNGCERGGGHASAGSAVPSPMEHTGLVWAPGAGRRARQGWEHQGSNRSWSAWGLASLPGGRRWRKGSCSTRSGGTAVCPYPRRKASRPELLCLRCKVLSKRRTAVDSCGCSGAEMPLCGCWRGGGGVDLTATLACWF